MWKWFTKGWFRVKSFLIRCHTTSCYPFNPMTSNIKIEQRSKLCFSIKASLSWISRLAWSASSLNWLQRLWRSETLPPTAGEIASAASICSGSWTNWPSGSTLESWYVYLTIRRFFMSPFVLLWIYSYSSSILSSIEKSTCKFRYLDKPSLRTG